MKNLTLFALIAFTSGTMSAFADECGGSAACQRIDNKKECREVQCDWIEVGYRCRPHILMQTADSCYRMLKKEGRLPLKIGSTGQDRDGVCSCTSYRK